MDSMRSLPGDGGGSSGYKGIDDYTKHVRGLVLGFLSEPRWFFHEYLLLSGVARNARGHLAFSRELHHGSKSWHLWQSAGLSPFDLKILCCIIPEVVMVVGNRRGRCPVFCAHIIDPPGGSVVFVRRRSVYVVCATDSHIRTSPMLLITVFILSFWPPGG